VNIINMLTIALAYGGTATMISPVEIFGICDKDSNRISETWDGPGYGIDFSGWPMVILGGALLTQTCISVWIMVLAHRRRKTSFKTWSSDAVVNAIFMILWVKPESVAKACKESLGTRRESAHKQAPRLRWYIRVLWGGFLIILVILSCTAYYAKRSGTFAAEYFQHDGWTNYGNVKMIIRKGSGVTDWAGKSR
jgi:hypothetical protein